VELKNELIVTPNGDAGGSTTIGTAIIQNMPAALKQ
jgi:hypothetical protein